MDVFLDIESHTGATATVTLYSFSATSNAQPMATPSAKTITSDENFFPQPFPNGNWNVTGVTHPNTAEYGSTKLSTDAHQTVTTYVQDPTGTWVSSGQTEDYGYAIHGGGYSSGDRRNDGGVAGAQSGPQDVNNVNDNTYGCIRLSNDNADQLGAVVQTSINDGTTVTLTVQD
jgi:hypothetical protein